VPLERGSRALLIVAFLVASSALAIAVGLGRAARRDLVAPEAWTALEQGQSERAAEIFGNALKTHPDDAMLHFGSGSAAFALGRSDAALSSLRRAIDLDPTFADAYVLLGQVAYERGQTDVAIKSMREASALRPRDGRVTELLAQWQHESVTQSGYLEKPAGHFRILYEGGTQQAIGDRVARVLEREYVRIGRALSSYPPSPLTVTLYTNQAFHDVTRSPSWSAGNYDGQIRIAVGGALTSGDELDRVATHELVHAVVASAAPRRVPTWLDEGLAAYLEGSDRTWASQALRNRDDVIPLDHLTRGFGGLDERAALVAYAESATAAEILCNQLGSNVGGFLRAIGDGRAVDQALLDFQIQPNAFHSEWRRRVGLQ
jgi:tetratricopeptide (TPR) repeat protein